MDSIKFLFLSIMVLVMIGCNSVEIVEEITPPAPMPVSTPPVLDHFDDCEDSLVIGTEEAKLILQDCLEDDLGSNCQNQYDLNVESVEEWYWNCLQMLPAVEQSCRESFDPQSFVQDSDGDGISDADEVLMNLNPCEACSYGGNCQNCGGGGEDSSSCDSEMDFDNDGIPNGEDEKPACGSVLPGGYFPLKCV
ncbi:hypothetical protein IT411_02895 [Candidatus Peregrinibacteria bacterium]|nr:hypothetical protein [Candidatus Peregrinibacteria bacterium]